VSLHAPLALLLATLLAAPPAARAHDPSAWGGLFRSRDFGLTWFPGTPGRIVSGAIGLAVSPADSNDLLLATDSGLLRSRNGGRDWEVEAPAVLIGPIFGVAFDATGRRAVASTASGLFRSDDGAGWRRSATPDGAAPARALVPGTPAGQLWLAGWTGVYRSEDWGQSWSSVADGLPGAPTTALAVVAGIPDTIVAVAGGRIWARSDDGEPWEHRGAGLPDVPVETVAVEPHGSGVLWSAAAGRLFGSTDAGTTWGPVGRPLPEPNTTVRGIAGADGGRMLVLTTDRGILRSSDGGNTWDVPADNLPAHLEAGPLVRDAADPATLYAGFALTPYPELWRLAAEGGSALGRLDPVSVAGGAAFLVVLALGAVIALRRLLPYYRPSPP
jgi:photosystem II stability/assembly factor-like uncharacterized protein